MTRLTYVVRTALAFDHYAQRGTSATGGDGDGVRPARAVTGAPRRRGGPGAGGQAADGAGDAVTECQPHRADGGSGRGAVGDRASAVSAGECAELRGTVAESAGRPEPFADRHAAARLCDQRGGRRAGHRPVRGP